MEKGDVMFHKETKEKVKILDKGNVVVGEYRKNEDMKTETNEIMVEIIEGDHKGHWMMTQKDMLTTKLT